MFESLKQRQNGHHILEYFKKKNIIIYIKICIDHIQTVYTRVCVDVYLTVGVFLIHLFI